MIFSPYQQENWKPANRLIFRIVFIYVTLYIALLLISPFLGVPLRWFSEHILNWGKYFSLKNTGSGDRTFDYVRLAFNVFLTVPTVFIWSVLDRRRKSYNSFFYWFRVFVRLTLICAMLIYGFAKVFKGQFGDHSLVRLLQTVGEMSPMGLAWTFMGHSFFYNIFIGFSEILGGILLIFKRTVTLGSMIILGVMGNVLMMNLTYDIPVKLFSAHLILLAFILISADGQRVIDFFFLNKNIEKSTDHCGLKNERFIHFISICKIAVTVLVVAIVVVQCFLKFNIRDQLKEKSEFYGIWEIQLFVKNKQPIPPLLTDHYRWRYLIIEEKKSATVKKMTDAKIQYSIEINSEEREVVFTRKNDSGSFRFIYEFAKPEQLELTGVVHGDSIYMQLNRKFRSDFELTKREFHWVNEFPYNL